MDHVLLVFIGSVTESNIPQITDPIAILRFPLMSHVSCPLMMMSGGLVFSQIPLQFLSQICQQNIHRLTDDSLGSDSRDQQPKLTLFFISPSEGKTPEAEDENIVCLEKSVQFTEDCHFHVIVPK